MTFLNWQKFLTLIALLGVLTGPITAGNLTTLGDPVFVEPQFAIARYDRSGDLDPSFGGDGKLLTNFILGGIAVANAMAIDQSGKIVVAGFAVVSGTRQFALARYNQDGSLDANFGRDGRVLTTFASGGDARAEAIAIDENGRIVVAGAAVIFGTRQVALARYTWDGELDPSFGGDGKVHTKVSSVGESAAFAVAVDKSGKVVVAGFSDLFGTHRFAVLRYNSDGSLDTGFGSDGKVLTQMSTTGGAEAHAVAIDGSGRIVVAGFAIVFGSRQFALARYNGDGSLDPLFNVTGKVLTSLTLGGDAEVYDLAIDEGGKIVAAGVAEVGFFGVVFLRFAVARYNAAGLLDRSFGKSGTVISALGSVGDSEAHSVAIDRSGKIVVAGFVVILDKTQFAIARYRVDGELDPSFGANGRVFTDFGFEGGRIIGRAVVNGIGLDGDERIVAAGFGDIVGTD